MKKILFTVLIACFGFAAQAQSDVIFTHFMFNRLGYNPAFAGGQGVVDIGAIYRNQWWSGIDGAPRTLNMFFHTPFAKNRNGAGISITSDQIGFYSTTSADLSYAYRMGINNHSNFSIGLSGRVEQTRTNWAKAQSVEPDLIAPIDDDATNRLRPNFGLGFFYKNDKKGYVGLSMPRILKNSLYTDQGDAGFGVNTMYLMGGYIHKFNRNVSLYPNAMITYNPSAPFELDLNVNVLLMDAIWLGASYRLGDSFDVLAQYYFKEGFRMGMAFDLTTSDLSKVTTGSWEVLLGYTLPCDNCDFVHPRFF